MGLFSGREERRGVEAQDPFVTQIPTITPEQKALLDQIIGRTGGIVGGEFGGRIAPFEGQLTAPVSGLEELAFGSVEGLFAPGGQTQRFLESALQPFSQEETIGRFEEFELPFAREQQAESRRQLLESLSGTGGFTSGATSRALARSGREFDLGLQSQLGQRLGAAEQFASQRQFGGLEALLGIQEQGLGAGGIQRGIEQEGLDRILNEFIRQQGVDPLLAELLGPSLKTSAFENAVQFLPLQSTGSRPSQSGSTIGGIVGAGIGGIFGGPGGVRTGGKLGSSVGQTFFS